MKQTIETIQAEKRQLNRKMEQVETQRRNVHQLEAEYDDFFHRLTHYTSELQATYCNSTNHWYLEDQVIDLRIQQRNIFNSFEESHEILHKQQRGLENEYEELAYAHKRLLAEEEKAHG
jgi:peptidoglycan hydrolase CwlO-like protein